jgi:transposase
MELVTKKTRKSAENLRLCCKNLLRTSRSGQCDCLSLRHGCAERHCALRNRPKGSGQRPIAKKSEKKKSTPETALEETKRKPGGQPGHQGKTRKGFGRVDRIELLRPQQCSHCGGIHFNCDADNLEIQQVAQLVANPIEVVEYHRVHSQCTQCGNICAAPWSHEIIPGQDLGVRLQALIGWLGNYAQDLRNCHNQSEWEGV